MRTSDDYENINILVDLKLLLTMTSREFSHLAIYKVFKEKYHKNEMFPQNCLRVLEKYNFFIFNLKIIIHSFLQQILQLPMNGFVCMC